MLWYKSKWRSLRNKTFDVLENWYLCYLLNLDYIQSESAESAPVNFSVTVSAACIDTANLLSKGDSLLWAGQDSKAILWLVILSKLHSKLALLQVCVEDVTL